MNKKKLLTYVHHFLLIALLGYLIIIWMYFKDTVNDLTSSQLVLGFVFIPLLFLIALLVIKRSNENLNKEISSDNTNLETSVDFADCFKAYGLFFYGKALLPEGENFNDIIENSEDLTDIYYDLLDYDGLPTLVKPIVRDSTLELVEDLNLAHNLESESQLDDTVIKVCELINAAILQNQETLLSVSETYAHQQAQQAPTNVAASMHPEWQQTHISSTDFSKRDQDTNWQRSIIKQVNVYLCLPESFSQQYDISPIRNFIITKLAQLGLPKAYLTVVETLFDPGQKTSSEVVDNIILTTNDNLTSKLNIFFGIDSEINQDWLDQHLSLSSKSSPVVPEEAVVFLMAWNQAANDILDLKKSANYNLIKFNKQKQLNNVYNQDCLDYLKATENYIEYRIKQKRQQDTGSVTDRKTTDGTVSDKAASDKAASDKDSASAQSVLVNQKVLVLADINALTQPYQASLYFSFTERLEQKGALVENHQLGLYMQRDIWLKSFINLSLFNDATFDSFQDYDIVLLLTEHSDTNLLWVAEPKLN